MLCIESLQSIKDVELFRKVITLVVEKKKKNINKQNFDGEANWSGVVNFHCMQMSLVMGMRFIFGVD